jgi:hypothetical protein
VIKPKVIVDGVTPGALEVRPVPPLPDALLGLLVELPHAATVNPASATNAAFWPKRALMIVSPPGE